MSATTKIEWTDQVWNPTTGCDRVSPGCDNCYALTMAKRLKGMGSAKYQLDGDTRTSGPGFGVTEHQGEVYEPFRWAKPRRVFVNSMSDLFHDSVSDGFIAQVWNVMAQCPQHTFQILTKRHARMRSWVTRWADTASDAGAGPGMPPMPRGPEAVRAVYKSGRGQLFADMLDSMGTPPPGAAYPLYDWMEGQRWWPRVLSNVWLGVSVEDQKWADIRIDALRETPAAVRMLSLEPLLGPLDSLDLTGIGWVIVGGESGPGARPMHPDWARSLRNQCERASVPFFFKQHGQYSPAWGQPTQGDVWVAPDGAVADWKPGDSHTRVGGGDFRWTGTGTVLMRRSRSKHDAGRELDGREWNEYPAQREVVPT